MLASRVGARGRVAPPVETLAAREVAPPRRQLSPRTLVGDPAVDQHHDPVGPGQRRRLRGRPDDRRPPLAQRLPELDLGGGVERRGDVVGQEQLGVAGQGPGQREPLHLTSGQAYAAVPDERVGSARLGHVAVEARRGESRLRDAARVVEQHVVAEGAREHPRHLGHVGDARGAELGLGIADRSLVPPDAPRGAHQPRQGAQQARLAGAHLAEQQHQLAGVHGEVDVAGADGPVVVDRGDAVERQVAQRLAVRRGRRQTLSRARGRCRAAGPSGRRRRRGGWWPASTRARRAPRSPPSQRRGRTSRSR